MIRPQNTRQRTVRMKLVLVLVLIFVPAIALAQTATVRRNVNLRPTPSTKQTSIRLLTPPEALTLLEANPTLGYYHVRTTPGEEGWVWGRNISFEPEVPPASGAAGHFDHHRFALPASRSGQDGQGALGQTGCGAPEYG